MAVKHLKITGEYFMGYLEVYEAHIHTHTLHPAKRKWRRNIYGLLSFMFAGFRMLVCAGISDISSAKERRYLYVTHYLIGRGNYVLMNVAEYVPGIMHHFYVLLSFPVV